MADGQVIIDSKLNVDGVEKGSKQIKSEFENLAKTTKKAAESIEKGFQDVDYKNAFDGLSDSAKQAYAKIELIRNNDADDNKTKADKIAAVYRELGDDQADAMKRAWNVVKDESAKGSRRVIDDLKEIGEKAEKAGKQIKGIGNGFKDVFDSDFLMHFLSGVAANAFDSFADFAIDSAKQAIDAAAEIAAANAMFEQTFKGAEETARNALQTISKETGIASTRMQTSFAKIFAFTKAVGGDTEKSMDIAARATRLAADNAAYFDTTVEEATETIYSFIKGNYENDAALNLVANEMARNAAANERYGKSFKDLSGLQQADTLLAMAEAANKASGAYGQAAREADSWANVTGELSEAWKQFTAVFGESVIEKSTPVLQFLTDQLNEYVELRRELEAKKNPVAEEFSEIETAAPPAAEAVNEIAEAYANAKATARESIDSQIGYFDEISLESETTAQKIIENWQKQQEAFSGYTANLQKAVDMGIDRSLIQQFSDGSTQSMIYLNALVNDASVSVDEINAQWENLNQIRDTTAGIMAGVQENFDVSTGAIGDAVNQMTADVSTGSVNALEEASNSIQTTVLTPLQESATATGEAVGEAFENAADTMKTAWGDMGTWFDSNVTSPVKASIESMSQSALAMWSEMESATTTAWANMVKTVQDSISKMQGSINSLTGKTVNVTVNKTGSGANLISYSGYDGQAYSPTAYAVTPQVPYLATGAVIPPNAPFLAMLGDQRNGTNIEAPMETIKQGVREVLEEMGFDVDVNINFVGELSQLIRILYPHIEVEKKRKGKSLAEGVTT